MERAAVGDGWFPQFRPDEEGRGKLGRLHEYTREAGRDPGDIGIDGPIRIAGRSQEEWVLDAAAWRDLGATHLSVNTRNSGLSFPDGHIDAIRRFMDSARATGLLDEG